MMAMIIIIVITTMMLYTRCHLLIRLISKSWDSNHHTNWQTHIWYSWRHNTHRGLKFWLSIIISHIEYYIYTYMINSVWVWTSTKPGHANIAAKQQPLSPSVLTSSAATSQWNQFECKYSSDDFKKDKKKKCRTNLNNWNWLSCFSMEKWWMANEDFIYIYIYKQKSDIPHHYVFISLLIHRSSKQAPFSFTPLFVLGSLLEHYTHCFLAILPFVAMRMAFYFLHFYG